MHVLVVMDPPSTVLVDEDTSFALMIEAEARGHRVSHALMTDLYLENGEAFTRCRSATMKRDPKAPITLGDAADVALKNIDAVIVRTDPPFDESYLWGSQVLECARATTFVMNDPRGLRDANEKLYACHFPQLMTDTLVTNDKPRIKEFTAKIGGKAVIKPLHGAGGAGVMALSSDDMNMNAIIEATTLGGKRIAMVQKFLPEVRVGDKRILLLNGEPLGAILRVPRKDDLRSNIHVGGTVVKTELDADDKKIVAGVAEKLRRDGLYFVGLDVIGGKLTEVNVTSPTGIQQMSRLDGVNYSERVIEWIEAKISSH